MTLAVTGRLLIACVFLLPGDAMAQGERARLLRTDRATADSSWNAGLGSALGHSAMAEVVLLWPGAPVAHGAANVARLADAVAMGTGLEKKGASGKARVTWQPLGAELSLDSTLGVTWGVVLSTLATPAMPVVGRYIATWQNGGIESGWRLAALMLTDAAGEASRAGSVQLPFELPAAEVEGRAGPFISADRAFAQLARDSGAAVAFERWAGPDAHMFAGGGLLVQGPAAIGRVVSAPATWEWHPVLAGAALDGSMGWTVGEAVITAADGHAGPSKYLTVWKRQPDGSIRYLTDGGNGRPSKR